MPGIHFSRLGSWAEDVPGTDMKQGRLKPSLSLACLKVN